VSAGSRAPTVSGYVEEDRSLLRRRLGRPPGRWRKPSGLPPNGRPKAISGTCACMEEPLCRVVAGQQTVRHGRSEGRLRPPLLAGRPASAQEGRGALHPDKGKRAERRGRKAMGLRSARSGASMPTGWDHDRQAAEGRPSWCCVACCGANGLPECQRSRGSSDAQRRPGCSLRHPTSTGVGG